jgi:hypothetical protein
MRKSITALIILLIVTSSVYADEPSSWAEEGIEALQETNAIEASFFDGYNDKITREEFAYLSVRLFEMLQGSDIVIDDTLFFTDTTNPYALKAATVGISSGVGNNKFAPTDFLTREQLAVMMIKTLNLGKLDMSLQFKATFKDTSEFSSWAVEAIEVAYANGIISGTGEGLFSPSGLATKEQAMVIVSNILKRYQDKSFQYTEATGSVMNMSIEDRYDRTNKAAFVKVYENNEYLGYTNREGQLKI